MGPSPTDPDHPPTKTQEVIVGKKKDDSPDSQHKHTDRGIQG